MLDETRYEFSIRENGTTVTKEHENTPDVASIHIHKVDDAGASLSDVCFLLEYSVDNGANWMPVQYRAVDSKVFAGGCTSERLENGLLETGEDGIVSFTGLCRSNAMGTVKYRLTETATAEGYLLLTEPAFEDYLPATGETDISLTVVNVPEFTIQSLLLAYQYCGNRSCNSSKHRNDSYNHHYDIVFPTLFKILLCRFVGLRLSVIHFFEL